MPNISFPPKPWAEGLEFPEDSPKYVYTGGRWKAIPQEGYVEPPDTKNEIQEIKNRLQELDRVITTPNPRLLTQTVASVGSGETLGIDLNAGYSALIAQTGGNYNVTFLNVPTDLLVDVYLTIYTTNTGNAPSFLFPYEVRGIAFSEIPWTANKVVRLKWTKQPFNSIWIGEWINAKFTVTGGDVLINTSGENVPTVNTDPPVGTRSLRHYPNANYSGAGIALNGITVGTEAANDSKDIHVSVNVPFMPEIKEIRYWVGHPNPTTLSSWDENPSASPYAAAFIGSRTIAPFGLTIDTTVDPTGNDDPSWAVDGSHPLHAQMKYVNDSVDYCLATFTTDNEAGSLSGDITIVGTSSLVAATSPSTMTPVYPAGYTAVADDLAVVVYSQRLEGTEKPVVPAGWTEAATRHYVVANMNDIRIVVYTKKLTVSESLPVFDVSNTLVGNQASMVTVILRGVNATSMDVTPVSADGAASLTFQAPSITPVTVGSLVMSVVATTDGNALALVTPNGFTALASGAAYDNTLNARQSLGIAARTTTALGAVTAPVWEATARIATLDFWSGITLAFRPLTSAPPTVVAPAIPTGLGGSTPSNFTVNITWAAAANAVSYEVRQTATGAWEPANGTLSHTFTSLRAGDPIAFYVRSVSSSDTRSAASSAITRTPTGTNPTISTRAPVYQTPTRLQASGGSYGSGARITSSIPFFAPRGHNRSNAVRDNPGVTAHASAMESGIKDAIDKYLDTGKSPGSQTMHPDSWAAGPRANVTFMLTKTGESYTKNPAAAVIDLAQSASGQMDDTFLNAWYKIAGTPPGVTPVVAPMASYRGIKPEPKMFYLGLGHENNLKVDSNFSGVDPSLVGNATLLACTATTLGNRPSGSKVLSVAPNHLSSAQVAQMVRNIATAAGPDGSPTSLANGYGGNCGPLFRTAYMRIVDDLRAVSDRFITCWTWTNAGAVPAGMPADSGTLNESALPPEDGGYIDIFTWDIYFRYTGGSNGIPPKTILPAIKAKLTYAQGLAARFGATVGFGEYGARFLDPKLPLTDANRNAAGVFTDAEIADYYEYVWNFLSTNPVSFHSLWLRESEPKPARTDQFKFEVPAGSGQWFINTAAGLEYAAGIRYWPLDAARYPLTQAVWKKYWGRPSGGKYTYPA
jgi:hypothetical protein